MLKNLKLPMPSNTEVDLSMINTEYKGVIIGYKDDSAVGFIIHDDNGWAFQSAIDLNCFIKLSDDLFELIQDLLKRGECTHFKVIEFGSES